MKTPCYLFCVATTETLYYTNPIMDDGSGPEEPYGICELVLARSRSQAKWMAYQTDSAAEPSPLETPRMSVQKLGGPFWVVPRIVSQELAWEQFWGNVNWRHIKKLEMVQ